MSEEEKARKGAFSDMAVSFNNIQICLEMEPVMIMVLLLGHSKTVNPRDDYLFVIPARAATMYLEKLREA